MNGDVPWIYVVMIFIAFVSWVSSRIKESNDARRARMAERRTMQESRNRSRPQAPPSPYLAETRPSREHVPAPEPEPEGPQTFRELFEMLREQAVPEPVVPPPTTTAPPPLPYKPVEAPAAEEDRKPSEVRKPSDDTTHSKQAASASIAYNFKGRSTSNIGRVLKHRRSLRDALVLKEILDTPKSLRE